MNDLIKPGDRVVLRVALDRGTREVPLGTEGVVQFVRPSFGDRIATVKWDTGHVLNAQIQKLELTGNEPLKGEAGIYSGIAAGEVTTSGFGAVILVNKVDNKDLTVQVEIGEDEWFSSKDLRDASAFFLRLADKLDTLEKCA